MSESRREEILAAFERLVTRYGLDKVTMQDLAREAGVSVGAIYLHFTNKDALVLAIEEKWRRHVVERNAKIVQSDLTPVAKLHGIVVEHVTQFSSLIRTNQAVFELLRGALYLRYIGRKVGDTRREILDAMIASVAEVMNDGCEQGVFAIEEVDRTARLFVEAFGEYFLAPEVIKKKHAQVAESAEGMFAMLAKAIRAESAAQARDGMGTQALESADTEESR